MVTGPRMLGSCCLNGTHQGCCQALRIVRQMKPQKGESLYLLIDDTRIKKRGKKMDGISKIWDPKSHCFVHGHIIVSASIQFRGVTIPWAIDLWIPKAQAGRQYRKLTEIAADLIARFPELAETQTRVLLTPHIWPIAS